ncbi:DUF4429 domain-containing protein [Streptomyces sp. 549]|uniref:DUF4429 domain-containing protein n=1 Tax=Streptomyces sp. 549 TaxID=3049076 RepID=UPI0024C3BF01|nr:DUF4429 domain-containing protein [Streptomyces sp. 549]MDK1473699.1 DUF4429 domain-containing protein [Streptomyces sp. 549]
MAELTQRDGTWTFDGSVLRLTPGGGRGVHPLRTALGELTVPLAAVAGISYEAGRKGGRLRLRLRAAADPLTQATGGVLPDAADPYTLGVEKDRSGAAEYLVDEVRNALLLDEVPVDEPADRYLLPGPPVPLTLNGSDGRATFDGEQIRIEWGWGAEETKKSSGPRVLALADLARVEWLKSGGWESGWVRFVPKGPAVFVKPSHDPYCVVLWGLREARETAESALLLAAVTARLPHPAGPAGPQLSLDKAPGPATGQAAQHGARQDADHDALLRRLRELAELHTAGVLTDEEFSAAKKAVLDRF